MSDSGMQSGGGKAEEIAQARMAKRIAAVIPAEWEKRRFILKMSCPDGVGLVAGVANMLADMGIFISNHQTYSDPSTGKFFMRLCIETTKPVDLSHVTKNILSTAQKFEMEWDLFDVSYRPRVLIMVSKLTHCLNDLLHKWKSNQLKVDIVGIVSNHPDAQDLANFFKVPYYHMPITPENQAEQETALLNLIEASEVELVILARYMRILSENVCRLMKGKIINIHHSFLPSFKGARPYHQAFERGVKIIGATAHYVTADLDEGPVIEQEVLRVDHTSTVEDLVRLGCDVECIALSRAVRWHIEQRVFLNDRKTVVLSG